MNPIIKPTSISIKPTFNQSVVRQLLEARLRRPQIVKKWVAAFRDGHTDAPGGLRLELTIIEAYVNDSIAAKLYGKPWRIHSSGRPIWDTDDNLG